MTHAERVAAGWRLVAWRCRYEMNGAEYATPWMIYDAVRSIARDTRELRASSVRVVGVWRRKRAAGGKSGT